MYLKLQQRLQSRRDRRQPYIRMKLNQPKLWSLIYGVTNVSIAESPRLTGRHFWKIQARAASLMHSDVLIHQT